MPKENAVSDRYMTQHRLGPTDFLHLPARPVRLIVDQGTIWVTQHGETEDILVDPGGWRDFDGHAGLMVSSLGGDATLQMVPLPPVRAQAGLLGLQRWLGSRWQSGHA